MGAKATYLPLLLGAVVLVLVAQLVIHRRMTYPTLAAAGLVAGSLAFAQLVLFGGVSQGLVFAPLATMRSAGAAVSAQLATSGLAPPQWLALMTAVTVFCWACVWSGAVGLLRPSRWTDPAPPLLAGIGGGGMAAVSLLSHPGLSQYFFLESARPYLAVLATWGLCALIRSGHVGRSGQVGRVGRGFGLALAVTAAAGAGVVWLVRLASGQVGGAGALAEPYLALVGALVLATAILWVARRILPVLRRPGRTLALIVALATGFGLPSGVDQVVSQALTSPNGWRLAVLANPRLTPGTVEAGRWLRDHSTPDDVVATNAHCRLAPDRSAAAGVCLGYHFSVAAFTERRVLVESWSSTATLAAKAAESGTSPNLVPFWDLALLAANDTAFTHPSPLSVGRLRTRYGVRWLFVDLTHNPPGPGLASVAEFRYRSGDCAVYEITR
jgi:hypothetical protein